MVTDVIDIEQIHSLLDVAEVEFLTRLEPFGPGGERGAGGYGASEGVVGREGVWCYSVIGCVGWETCCEMANEKDE